MPVPTDWIYKKGVNRSKKRKAGKCLVARKPLVLPFTQFYNFFAVQFLFSLPFVPRMNKLLTYDIYRNPPVHSSVPAFVKLTGCDIFTINRDRLYEDYLRELRARTLFKRLLYAWRIRKIIRNSEQTSELLDPITFMPIEKPVYVYDLKQGRRFLFEAQTLGLSIRKNLYAQQYGISRPKRPINVIMNRAFSQNQMMSIYDQLTRYGIRIPDIGIYRRFEFNIERWKIYMCSQLQMQAYYDELYDYQSDNGRDMLHDYIIDSMNFLQYPYRNSFKVTLLHILNWWPDHPILDMLRSLCFKSYEAEYFHLNVHPILMMRCKRAIDALWPKSELLENAIKRQNAITAPVVDEDGDTYMEDMEELND